MEWECVRGGRGRGILTHRVGVCYRWKGEGHTNTWSGSVLEVEGGGAY